MSKRAEVLQYVWKAWGKVFSVQGQKEGNLESGLVMHKYYLKLACDNSRGTDGGAFFQETLFSRKEAKTSNGKNVVEELKEFFLQKSDGHLV